jgi:hypothetical protein
MGRPVRRSSAATISIAMAALAFAWPADADSPAPAYEALKRDLERLVEVQEAGSWRIDRYEIEDMMPSALMTVCRVPKSERARALAFYDRRIAELGGPVEAAWARTKDLSAIRPLVFATRVRSLLAEANKRAETECAPWMEEDPAFLGLQSDAHRWSLNVETGGMLQLRKSAGHWTYGGGGVARLLVSRGFSHTTLLFGPEFAGGAMLRVGAEGFVVNYFPAFPVVLRMHDGIWHYDVEVAPVALFQADDTRRSFGFRFGLGSGVMSRRARGVIPWAGIGVAYETYPSGARPAAQFLRGGLRVGIVW